MKRFGKLTVGLLLCLQVGCSNFFIRPTISSVDISPRVLPPEGGKVKIVVKTFNAGYVRVYFVRKSDGKTFTKELSMEFWLGVAYGEQKWDGEISLPPNNDPEGKDQVYKVTVRAWSEDYFSSHERSGGEVTVKSMAKTESG